MYPVAPGEEDWCVHAPAYPSFGRRALTIRDDAVVAAMSVFTTFAPSTVTPPSRDAIVSVSPLTAFAELVLSTSAAMIFPATT